MESWPISRQLSYMRCCFYMEFFLIIIFFRWTKVSQAKLFSCTRTGMMVYLQEYGRLFSLIGELTKTRQSTFICHWMEDGSGKPVSENNRSRKD
jgi:hypothetical protein